MKKKKCSDFAESDVSDVKDTAKHGLVVSMTQQSQTPQCFLLTAESVLLFTS